MVARDTPNFLRRWRDRLHALSGWLLIYVAVGGALGFGVWLPYTEEPSCLPFRQVFGLITSSCPVQAVNLFWDATIGVPRFLLIFPGIAFAMFRVGLLTSMHSRLLDGFWFLLLSLPLALLLWAGMRYWLRRRRAVAWIAVAAIGLQIVWIGLSA